MLSTLSEVGAFNARWDYDVRLEELNGEYILIKHNTTTHIGTIIGEAREYVVEKLAPYGGSDAAANETMPAEIYWCGKHFCLTFLNCGNGCYFCYPIVCI
jgi:hypothetical protein